MDDKEFEKKVKELNEDSKEYVKGLLLIGLIIALIAVVVWLF